jgi:hypothetical protein
MPYAIQHTLPIIFVIIIVIIWINTLYNNFNTANNILTGFWEADSSFLSDSGLESLSIYFGEKKRDGSRSGYVLIKKDCDMLVNDPTKINITEKWKSSCDYKSVNNNAYKNLDIEFKNINNPNFPSIQSMKFYPTVGKIILYKKDIIYAVLYKNSVLSELSIITKEIKTKKN